MMCRESIKSWKEVSNLCAGLGKSIGVVKDSMNEGVAIFGAGTCGCDAARYLKKMGINILCFVDNDPAKQGTFLSGIPVVPPQDLSVSTAPFVLIATRQAMLSVKLQLDGLGVNSLSFDAFCVAISIERILYVRNKLLCDDRSRLIYDAILKTIITGDNSYCASVKEGNQYFALPEFEDIGNDYFVDVGAYVGDTLEKFIWTTSGVFAKIYAFEPGKPQLEALKCRIERLCKEWAIPNADIICENAGLSDENKELNISMSSVLADMSLNYDGSKNNKQSERISCYSLDNYLKGQPASFIKADIEGMELEMLHGAKETIQRFKPKMALSVYHAPAHLFEIAEFVNNLVPEYRMAIRQHSNMFAESVLYCWVP